MKDIIERKKKHDYFKLKLSITRLNSERLNEMHLYFKKKQ